MSWLVVESDEKGMRRSGEVDRPTGRLMIDRFEHQLLLLLLVQPFNPTTKLSIQHSCEGGWSGKCIKFQG